jgi:hypothetical protein
MLPSCQALHMVSHQLAPMWLYCYLQVAAYRWLARYTPGKDVAKPTDRCAIPQVPADRGSDCS